MKIEELIKLEAKATGGPWLVHTIKGMHRDRPTRYISVVGRGIAVVHGLDEYKELPPDHEADANQALVVALRNNCKAMFAVVKAAKRWKQESDILARICADNNCSCEDENEQQERVSESEFELYSAVEDMESA